MKFKIKNSLGIAVLLLSQGMVAQFYVGVQSGIANIQNDVKETTAGYRLGGALKVGYVYALTDHFGIGSGIEFSQYKQVVSLFEPSGSLSNFEVDESTSAFVYTVTASNYKEQQTLHAIQVPLFVQYKTSINKGVDFNFRAGAKYFLPMSYKINASASSVKGSAYYPDVNLTIDDLPEYGFGTQSNYSASGKYETKGVVMSMFELGFTFDIGKKNAIYAAMFLEKGYGSIVKQDNNESFIGYNPSSSTDRAANGLYSTDKNAKIQPESFGLTLAWNFK